MATLTRRMLFVVASFVACWSQSVMSTEFQVGADKGWNIPNTRQEDRDFYNEWASKHRFKINDTVRFKYDKDSVLVVTEAEYDKCKASHPIFFSNNEDTVVRLDRGGLFYFISGVAGHCERGQKMIIKVLEDVVSSPPPSSSSSSSSSAPNHNHTAITTPPPSNSTAATSTTTASSLFVVLPIMLLLLQFI